MSRAAVIERVMAGDLALVSIGGVVDEAFEGFGDLQGVRAVVVDVGEVQRITSFGVRQWIRALERLPKTLEQLYLLSCPTFFIDQLNMVLNFGGSARLLTFAAPFTCKSCGAESNELIDVTTERMPPTAVRRCVACGGMLECDEPASFFAFVEKYGATSLDPQVASLLAREGRYNPAERAAEKPPRLIKLVHGNVTYFRIVGVVGSMFRARPLLVGVEGEVAIDLADLERFDADGILEWRKLIRTLGNQVDAITLVDVPEASLAIATEALAIGPIAIFSVFVRYTCDECRRVTSTSEPLRSTSLADGTCPTCGGHTRTVLRGDALQPLRAKSAAIPADSRSVIERRAELLSRAMTDANVAVARSPVELTPNDTILGKYKIVRRLSAGGMAEVFLATQMGIGGFEKPVAIKRIQRKRLDARQQAIELFLNEAKIAGQLAHPNIAQVIDVAESGGALYIAMDYIHGRDLRKLVGQMQRMHRELPVAVACHIVHEVALALDYAFYSKDMAGKRMRVVHRDVTPHNIVIGYDGTVKLVDFGVAMSSVTEHAEPMIVGKWSYMSPEITLNEVIDHRSDLFSLGVVFYLLLTGSLPFPGANPREIVQAIRAGHYPPIARPIPPELAALVQHMLASQPDARPQRGKHVAAELAAIARAHAWSGDQAILAQLVNELMPVDGPVRITDSMEPVELVRAAPVMSSLAASHHDGETSSRTIPADISETLRPERTFEPLFESNLVEPTFSPAHIYTAPVPPVAPPPTVTAPGEVPRGTPLPVPTRNAAQFAIVTAPAPAAPRTYWGVVVAAGIAIGVLLYIIWRIAG